MLFYKLLFHIGAMLKKLQFKLVYGKRVRIAKGVTFRRNFSLMIDKGGYVELGENCFFNNDCSIGSINRVVIGKNSIFGENVKLYDHNHKFRDPNQALKHQGYTSEEISIGENCWIGSNVVILKGTHIGNHCVIGAGCVVSGVIEDNSIVKQENHLVIQKMARG